MSLSLALSLTPIMSGTIRGLVVLIESTLGHDAACHTLEAQCASLQAQVDAARAHVLQEKAAQRRLRADIVAFLKERSESRSANSSRVLGPEDVSVVISTPGTSTDEVVRALPSLARVGVNVAQQAGVRADSQ
ncbi:hypothetical protein LXA43DRAFT_1058539 [Ganoderma leucocontextum]|nr:hypothetical protein LXA43DRAFT_1058539 [Ganoderma leucocontextum]